jgi:hypothetical protein
MNAHATALLRFRPLAVLLALTLTQCAIFGPSESFDRAKSYDVRVPESWVPSERGEADRAYRTPSRAIVTLTSSCTRPTESSLEQLTRHLFFGLRNVELVERQTLTLDGQPALRSRVTATLEGKPVHLEVVVLRHDVCVFDFSLMSPRALGAPDRNAFQQFVTSFRLGKGGR